MSGNPFRRNAPGNVKLQAEEKIERAPSPFKMGKKEKRVKIQTPPQSPEEIPRRLSAGNVSPPPPERDSSSDDDSDTTATADSDIDQAVRNTRRNSGSLAPPGTATQQQIHSGAQSPAMTPGPGAAPYNPFARTLASNDAAFGLQKSNEGQDDGTQSKPEGGKKGIDVDMFKNILMTGSPAPTPPQQQAHQPQDSSSNTDTSSLSKHSLFDQNYNLHPESPRSSFDHNDYSDDGEADDENGGLMGANKERLDDFAPPAPPKPGQPAKPSRGPQTVSFADFDNFSPVEERSSSPANAALAGKHRPPALHPTLHRTASDLNKPLPKTPPRSPGLPQEQPLSLDTQVAQTPQPSTPTVTSPDETTKKAPPPPPPTSRRAGQAGTSHIRARSTSDATHEPSSPQSKPPETTHKSPAAAPPPPPPSRKAKPTPHATSPAASTSASEAPSANDPAPPESENKTMHPPPAPAPRRNPSTKTKPSSVHRSSSNASRSSIARHEAHAPPAPPPRRAAGSKRESLDGAANRRSSQNSFESARSRATLPAESEEAVQEKTKLPESDVLADMSAFQAEIDEMRKRAERGG